jgi:hypothetical protein
LFFGGARGGGKSDYLLGDFLKDVQTYGAAWRGLLLRRTYPELQEIIVRSREIFPASGATWREADKEWHWSNGAYLRLRYLERSADASRYQGHQYTWIGWDELPQWPNDEPFRMLFACLRSAAAVPTKRVRGAGNPGGPGHQWVKARYIDPAPSGYTPLADGLAPWERMFIPSRVQDNAILLSADPTYVARLKGSGSPELVKAWLEGDWTIVAGAFFPEWSAASHVVQPMALPSSWARFRALDWGSARPFSVLWFAVSDGALPQFPRGALVVYREWYGSTGEPNVGLRLTAEEVARGIAEREARDPVPPETRMGGVADPSMFSSDGGPSIAERMRTEARIIQRPADNARVARVGAMGGWDQVRARLKGDGERPGLFVFAACAHLIRTLPALQHDQHRPEDVDTEGEDHAADALRYGCMARPYVRVISQPAPPRFEYGAPAEGVNLGVSISELIRRAEKRRRAI